MCLKNIFSYKLNGQLTIQKKNDFLFIKGRFNYFKLRLPSYYFIKVDNYNNYYFIFDSKYKIYTVMKTFLNIYGSCFKVYFFRLKLRGLGYKIFRFDEYLIRFFFGIQHFFYLHKPRGIYLFKKGLKLFFFSNSLSYLNNFFKQLLLLKKYDPYERTKTFIIPNRIVYMKKFK